MSNAYSTWNSSLFIYYKENNISFQQTIILSLVVILAIIASQIYNKTADNATEKETNTETERNVKDKENETKPSSIYDFSVKDILGNTIDLNIYRGYVILIVNVASECGFTDSNYRDLSALKKVKVNGKPLRILAFPCNQFGGQEPGSNKDIMNFARSRNAPFDYFEKIDVYGVNAHPLFKYLQEELGSIYWNFYKFIINENGIPVYKLASNTYYDDILSTLKELFENVDY